MSRVVKPIDLGSEPVAINAWMMEADRLIWSEIAQAMRVAGETIRIADGTEHGSRTMSLAYRRANLASAEGEIARARGLSRFLLSPTTKSKARRAIAASARCVRQARGV